MSGLGPDDLLHRGVGLRDGAAGIRQAADRACHRRPRDQRHARSRAGRFSPRLRRLRRPRAAAGARVGRRRDADDSLFPRSCRSAATWTATRGPICSSVPLPKSGRSPSSRHTIDRWRPESTRGGGRWWSQLDRRELTWLFVGLGLCVLLFGFVSLAGEVTEGDTQAFDTKILKALRDPADPSRPIGPAWMEEPLLDLTAIGGSTVLGPGGGHRGRFPRAADALPDGDRGRDHLVQRRAAERRHEARLQPSAAVDRSAPARGLHHQLPERTRDGIGDRLPDARGDPDAGVGVAGDEDLHSRRSPCC